MPYVVEMSGYDTVSSTTKTARFVMGTGISFTDQPYAPGGLARWASVSQRVDISKDGRVELSADKGEISIINMPDTQLGAGPFDAMADWVWQNRVATLYFVPARLWSERQLIGSGILEQPVVNLSAAGSLTSALRFVLRDPRASLETPLQPAKFAGTNVGPTGVEGGTELKGKPKPIIYGLVSNISPPLVNASLLIYQLADKPVSVLCVRDGAVSLTVGTVRGSLASLQSSTPPSGKFDIFSGAQGTFIRLGTTPIYNLTVDADEAASEAAQSHAQIWKRIREQRVGSTSLDAASITAADALDVHGAGFYWAEEATQKDALNEVLGSFSGYEILNGAGAWQIAKLTLPSGNPVLELAQVDPSARLKATTRVLTTINRVRPTYAPDGAPPFRVTVNWGRNYTVMGDSDFAGVANTRLKSKFGTEYRAEVATNTAIWNPDTKTGPWTNAPEITVNTAYQPGADGIDSPGAAAEAARLLTLLTALRGQYQVAFVPERGDVLLPGQVVRVIYPRLGLTAGALFKILEAGLLVEDGKMRADLVIGFQT